VSDEHRIHERFSGDAAAYALGALEPDEAEAFRRHLETCAICRDELAALMPVADLLPMAAPQQPVPRGLRRRVLAQARTDARAAGGEGAQGGGRAGAPAARPRLRRPMVAGGLVAAVVAAVIAGVVLLSGGTGGTRVFPASVGHATLYVSAGRAQLVVRRLPVPRHGRVYEVWLLRPHRAPSRSSLFVVGPAGSARVNVRGDIHGVSGVAVTQEPAGGTSRPTSAILIVTPVT
jgi:anti-sigma-K factor RskA